MNERRPGSSARVTLVAIAAVASALGGCGDDDDQAPTTSPSGVANPASEYCVAQGGTVEIVDEYGGQVGYCNLPDGTRIEEWEYFRAQTEPTTAP